jgi:hypothetical protein
MPFPSLHRPGDDCEGVCLGSWLCSPRNSLHLQLILVVPLSRPVFRSLLEGDFMASACHGGQSRVHCTITYDRCSVFPNR